MASATEKHGSVTTSIWDSISSCRALVKRPSLSAGTAASTSRASCLRCLVSASMSWSSHSTPRLAPRDGLNLMATANLRTQSLQVDAWHVAQFGQAVVTPGRIQPRS